MFTTRALTTTLSKAASTFPAIVLTGPRQSGKTTLLRHEFGGTHGFVSLEDPDVRLQASDDPRAFLALHRPPVILDEIQYVPELLSYIKSAIDSDRTPGHWILSGSQSFQLMQGVGQSLAGRAAILTLHPLALGELLGRGDTPTSVRIPPCSEMCAGSGSLGLADWMLRGGYPEPALTLSVDRDLWFRSYVATCLERDIRQIINVADLALFNRFIRLCAGRTGQLLNMSGLSSDLGISVPTVKRWISLLETSGIIFLLPPYHANFGKRLTKTPKLYFVDTALAASLIGIRTSDTLLNGPSMGQLFETAIVSDVRKRYVNSGRDPTMYFFRTADGGEVDLVVENDGMMTMYEMKSAMTLYPKHAAGLVRWKRELGERVEMGGVVYARTDPVSLGSGVVGIPWQCLGGG